MQLLPLVIVGSLAAAPALAQTRDRPPTTLPSSSQLRQDKPNSESWTYVKPGLNLAPFTAILINPTVVYTGPDAQFDKVSVVDRQKFAQYMTQALRTELAKSFRLVDKSGPGVLRIKLTLLGAQNTTGGVATASRVLPLGLVTNAVKSAAGKKGSFSGSVLFAVEVSNARTGELQAAAVRRQAPDALDIPATISTSDTVKAVARDIARRLHERLMQRGMRPAK